MSSCAEGATSQLRIIVGTDGNDRSGDALELARQLAGALRVELSVAVVLEFDPVPMLDLDPYEAALAEHFDQVLEHAARALGGHDFEPHRLTGGSPARSLTALAQELQADLLIVGSARRGRVGRILAGSVGGSLLSGAPCAVAVAPSGFAEQTPRPIASIAVGYDARGESEAALRFADDLACRLHASLQLLAVNGYPPRFSDGFARPADLLGTERHRLADAVVAAGSRSESELASAEVIDGYPPDALTELSTRVDLLVVGSRGYGPLAGVFLGGVGSRLARRARCPLVVVPRPVQDGPQQLKPGAAEAPP